MDKNELGQRVFMKKPKRVEITCWDHLKHGEVSRRGFTLTFLGYLYAEDNIYLYICQCLANGKVIDDNCEYVNILKSTVIDVKVLK